jgi:hypothetical protein
MTPMKRPDESFSETTFYHEREAAILGLLRPASLLRPAAVSPSGSPVYDFSNAIHYAVCTAGHLGLPLDCESVSAQVQLLYQNADPGRWPEISRLLSELYARARTESLSRLQSDFASGSRMLSIEAFGEEFLFARDSPKTARCHPAAHPPPRRARRSSVSVVKRPPP